MSNQQPTVPESVTANVTLSGPDWQLQAKMTVPTGATRLRQLLPMVESMTDAMVSTAAQAEADQGRPISCKKGCGACCRQLVPISEVEARHIREVVSKLPEPRRTTVLARFAEARRQLEASGLLDSLNKRADWSDGEGRAIGLRYFAQGIPCPFLEEESCSIYHDRPVTCREYLVTSPAENCARPSPETVRMVRMPMKVWTALARFDPVSPTARYVRWVPLILAPEWAEAHPEELPPRPGPDWLRQLFDHLTRRKSAKGLPLDPASPAAADEPI